MMGNIDQLIQLVIKILKKSSTKVIGIRDLQNAAIKSGIDISVDDENVGELCFRLREEGVIAHVQGKGVFQHIRIVD